MDSGLLAVIAGGVLQGSFMLPMKWTRRWAWENTWLVFAFTAYLFCPWLLVTATTPQAFAVYGSTEASTLAVVLILGLGWGLGAVTFGLGVDALGLALGFAIILGVAASVGVFVPLLLLPVLPAPEKLLITGVSLAVMLSGVAVCSLAGRWKEQKPGGINYGRGVALCAVSGLLSACGNLGFAFGRPLIDRAQAAGVPSYLASNVVWALLTLALFVCNAGYALLLLFRNRTGAKYQLSNTWHYYLFGFLMGAMWMGGFVFYGAGARRLGAFGPSLGWAILMSSMVLTANVLGVLSGEWKGAPSSAMRKLSAGLGLLLFAIAGLGYANAN